MKSMNALKQAICTASMVALMGCSGGGVGVTNYSDGNNSGSDTIDAGDDTPGVDVGTIIDGANSTDEGAVTDAHLTKLDFSFEAPSVVSLLFHAQDSNQLPITGLTNDLVNVSENDSAVDQRESFTSLWGREMWNYSFDTVVMLDVSSSISDGTLQNVRSATKLLWQNSNGEAIANSQQRFALYSFDASPTIYREFSSNLNSLNSGVDEIQKQGVSSTDLYGAVVEGVSKWDTVLSVKQISLGAMLIVTDGRDTSGRYTQQEAINAIGDDRPVFVINLNSSENADVLRTLATGGYYSANNATQINAAVESIRQQMDRIANSYYLLRYATPKRESSQGASASSHKFTVSVKDNQNRGSSATISETFNSAGFYDVVPEVLVAGPTQVALASNPVVEFTANTAWARQSSNYQWQVGTTNGACGLDDNNALNSPVIRIRFFRSGICQLTATDITNGPSIGLKPINVF